MGGLTPAQRTAQIVSGYSQNLNNQTQQGQYGTSGPGALGVGGYGGPRPSSPPTNIDLSSPAGRALAQAYAESGVTYDSVGRIIYNPADMAAEKANAVAIARGQSPQFIDRGTPSTSYLSALQSAGVDIKNLTNTKSELAKLASERTQTQSSIESQIKDIEANLPKLDKKVEDAFTMQKDKTYLYDYKYRDQVLEERKNAIGNLASLKQRLSVIDTQRKNTLSAIAGTEKKLQKAGLAQVSNTSPLANPLNLSTTPQRLSRTDKLAGNQGRASDAIQRQLNYQRSINTRAEGVQSPFNNVVQTGQIKVRSPIQYSPLQGSTITARQLKQIQAGKLTEAQALSQNEARGQPRTGIVTFESSKILPDIAPVSTGFLSITGLGSTFDNGVSSKPTPPIKPKELTQTQVQNLTEPEYRKYLAEIDRYNADVEKYRVNVEQYNRQIERENEYKTREYISGQGKAGYSTLIIESNGRVKQTSIPAAYGEYSKTLKQNPKAILKTPSMISLTESLNFSDSPLGPIGFSQDMQGRTSTLVAEVKPIEPIFRPNEFIPISINKDNNLVGLATQKEFGGLVTLAPATEGPPILPTQQSNAASENFDKFSKGIEDATKRFGKGDILSQAIGEAGKAFYTTLPAGGNILNQYVVTPLESQISKDTSFKRKELYVPQTITGIGTGALIAAPYKAVMGEGAQGARQELSEGYSSLDKYVKEYGVGTIPGAVIELVAPTPVGGKLLPFSIGRQTFEIIPKAGVKYTKYVVRGPSEKGEIFETFKTLEDATRRQNELIESGISKEAKIGAQFTPVSSLQFVGNSLITKVGGKYKFGGLKNRSDELTKEYKFLDPIEPIEIATLKPFSRDIFLSSEGKKALIESGRAGERDIASLDIQSEIAGLVAKNRKSLKPKDYGNLTGLESLKTPKEQDVLLEDILPKSKVPTKGHAAEIAQVRPDILNQVATRATTGDIDRDFTLANPLRSIGLGSIAEKISYRAAKKDAERAQKLLQNVAEGKRTFQVQGTKVYANDILSQEKVLENLTEKEATGKGSVISDYNKIFGSKYRYNIVKGKSPKGKAIKYRSLEDQLFSKLASTSRLQSERTGIFTGQGKPDYLKTGKFETTQEGFAIRTDMHRVKDFVDTIKLDIPEISTRLKESGKSKVGTQLDRLGKKLESLYPEIDFGATSKITEPLGKQTPIPSRLSQIGITPKSIISSSPTVLAPLSSSTGNPSRQQKQARSQIQSLIDSKISPLKRSSISALSSELGSRISSEISPVKSSIKSYIKSPSRSNISKYSPVKSNISSLASFSKGSPISKTSPISKASPASPVNASPISTLSPISPISPIIPLKPKPIIPPVPPVIPKIPERLKTKPKRTPKPARISKFRFFYTNPSDPRAPGVIMRAGVPELRGPTPSVFKEVDVRLRKARKRKDATYGVYQPYAGLELNKIVGKGFKATNLLSQRINI